MRPLQLESFIEGYRDYELGQYTVLAGLKKIREDFSHHRLYPGLSELVNLYQLLVKITQAGDGLRNFLPKRIVGVDLESHDVIYETVSMSREELNAVEELMHWALPKVREAIEEGRTIYNFVEEQVHLEEVGLLPSYVDEGYLLVPDRKNALLHVVRYEVSIFSGPDQKYRNLKTRTIKSYPVNGMHSTPWHVKQLLMAEQQDLPNPATYSFESEIDFPYEQTLLPIAKRKLLGRLYS